MSFPKQHIFVCTNERAATDLRGCCMAKGSEKVLEAFRLELKARELKGSIRANKAGCLDQCAFGASVVIYPEGTWYGGVNVTDVPEILDAMAQGKIVSRLARKA